MSNLPDIIWAIHSTYQTVISSLTGKYVLAGRQIVLFGR
jgi:hypothetical protein